MGAGACSQHGSTPRLRACNPVSGFAGIGLTILIAIASWQFFESPRCGAATLLLLKTLGTLAANHYQKTTGGLAAPAVVRRNRQKPWSKPRLRRFSLAR